MIAVPGAGNIVESKGRESNDPADETILGNGGGGPCPVPWFPLLVVLWL